MVDLLGIGAAGEFKSGHVCTKQSMGVEASNALCDRTDCPSYGKWYCPFTGW